MIRKQIGKKSTSPRTRIAKPKSPPRGGGEGNREADRHYRDEATRFAQSGKSGRAAEKAAEDDDAEERGRGE